MTLGLYAINPRTQRAKWMAIDADYRRSLDVLLKLQYELQQDGIQAALEQSRRGGHAVQECQAEEQGCQREGQGFFISMTDHDDPSTFI